MKKVFIYILLSLHVFFTGNVGIVLNDYFSITSAASTTISYAGTATDLGDSTQGWITPNNAQGNTTATSANMDIADRDVNTNTLALTNFNLLAAGLPASAIIDGISVDVEWQVENFRVQDSRVQLTKDGVNGIGNNYANNAAGPTTKSITNYGGATDLWGTTWTTSELLDSNFGVLLQYVNTKNPNRLVDIYRVAITVDYTVPANPILDITKTDNDADNTVSTGQIVTYTITVNNSGTNASGISLTDNIDTDLGTPYNFTYSNCGSPGQSFTDPTLSFSSIDVLAGNTCTITYDVQVDLGATGGNTITNSADASAAVEGGNNPPIATADTLTVLACGINDVSFTFETDTYGEDTFWSLTPNGNACGIGEIANGGNPGLTCADAGSPASAGAGDPYPDASIITEGPLSLTVGTQYDLHVIDDFGDGITVGAGGTDPDVRINQNGVETNAFSVTGNGGVFTFTVQEPTGCVDTINPSVTINQAPTQVDPTSINSAVFKVVFDEVINTGTFTSTDITLSGTSGAITSGPTQVAPNNGTSFEFTVNGMSPADIVTATIPSGGIEDLSGNTNNTSTSIDNQITYNGAPPSNPILGVTYSDSDLDNSVQSSQVVQYNLDISNVGTDATGISAVIPIDSNFGTPYGFTYLNCGTPLDSFSSPNLSLSNISILGGNTCNIVYNVQVDNLAPNGSSIISSANVSAALEGGNDPVNIVGDTLSVIACGVNDVNIDFVTDNWGYETFWSLTPNGNSCGVGEIVNGGNTTQVNCASGGSRVATTGNGYGNNTTINEGAFSLIVGNQYDLHVVDDYGDGITTSPDVTILQNGGSTDTFEVNGNGGVFTFTVQQPAVCSDTINPEVSINQAGSQTDPTTTNSATFSVIFNEVINTGTFTSADITLSGTTGTITTGPTQVAPNNGTSFEFTVTGMTIGDTVTAIIGAGLIQDLSGNTNNVSTSIDNQVTYAIGDTTSPVITATNFASGSLLPGGNHDIIIGYSDADSGIDSASAIMQLYKWDGVSAYGSNIAGTGITFNSASTSVASYSTNNLSFGKYQYRFSISDNAGNPVVYIQDFYIDEPELLIGSGSIDIGNLSSLGNTFSDTVTVTVKTVGAAFDVTMDRSSSLSEGTENIPSYNGSLGYGFQQAPYTSIISEIGASENIASQAALMNTNGNKNTYTYDIQIGTLIDLQQAAGNYEGNLDFSINLTY